MMSESLLETSSIPTNLRLENTVSPEDIPEEIKIRFVDDVDIDIIDQAIKLRYKFLKQFIPGYVSKIKKLNTFLKNLRYQNDVKNIKNQIRDLEHLVDDYTNDVSLKKYIREASDLVVMYKKKFKKITYTFSVRQEESENTQDYIDERICLINRYITVAKKYISIDVVREVKKGFVCKGCGKDLENTSADDDGLFTCPNCLMINNKLTLNTYYHDPSRTFSSKIYEDAKNFTKIIEKFEGKQIPKPTQGVYNDLTRYFEKIKFPSREEIQKRRITVDGKREGTTKAQLWTALEKTKNNAHYDDVNLIAHVYWGWVLPDLTKYKKRMMNDYYKTQQVWNKIKHQFDRDASLGTQFRLLAHLLAVDYPWCQREDFKIQESVDSLNLHNSAWKIMCEKSGVKYHYIS